MDDNTPKPKIEYSEFKRILEAQRAGNKTAEAIETSSKKLNDLTEEIRNDDKKVVGEQEKSDKELNANIKELVKITRESAKDIAKVIADKQPKSFGDNLKSKFDSKFGSVRNILDTMGIVKKGTGGMLDNALNRREADKTFIKGDMKLHGSSEQEARNKLQTIKEKEKIVSKNEKEISKFTKLGISEEQLGKTANGKKLLDTRRTNVQEISKLDYRVQPQLEEAKKEKNKAPMGAKNKTPMGTTPVSAVLANTNNPQIKTDENEQEAIKREDDQTDLLKRIAENTGGKEKFKSEKKDDLGDSLSPLGIGIAVAAGTIAGLVSAWVKTVKLFVDIFGKGLTALGEIFPSLGKAMKLVQETFTGFIEGIKGIFSSAVGKLASMFESAIGLFKTIFGESTLIGKVIAAVKSGISGFLEPIRTGFTALAESTGPLSKLFGAVASIVKKIAYPLMVIMAVWDTIKGALKGWEEGGLIGAIGGAIKGLFNSLVGGVADMIKGAISWIAGALGFTAVENFLDSFSFEDLFSDLVDAILFIPQTIQNFIMHPIDSIMKLGTIIMDTFSGIVHVFDPVIDFFSGIGDSIIGMLEGIGIPEMGFTIPIIGKKVSIGPFYPFKKDSEAPADSPSTDAAGGTTKAVPPENDNPVSGVIGGVKKFFGFGGGDDAKTTSPIVEKSATPIPGGGQTVDPSAQNYNAAAAGTETKVPEKASPMKGSFVKGSFAEAANNPKTQNIIQFAQTAQEEYAKGTPGFELMPDKETIKVTNKDYLPEGVAYKTTRLKSISSSAGGPITNSPSSASDMLGTGMAQGIPTPAGTGNAIEAKTGDVANSRDDLSSKGGGTSVVNAPTTVNNNSQTSSHAKSPFRNEEGTLNKYYASRLGAY